MSKITVIVSGETGSGKSAIAGEIEIALKAIGVPVEWTSSDREHWHKGNEYWIDLYKPEVTIIENNIPRAIKAPASWRMPVRMANAFNAWLLWINVPIYTRRKIEVRRIDVLLVVLGVICGVYYYLEGGWLGAAQGVALYTFVALVSLWMF